MLSKLKKLFQREPREAVYPYPFVEVLSFEDGLLKIRYDEKLGAHTRQVCINTSTGVIGAEIELVSFDPGELCYRARLIQQSQVLSKLRLERRGALRIPSVLRVFSRSLPSYQAITEDISLTGIKIKTRELLELAHDVELKLELDDPKIEPLELLADVTWSAQKIDGTFHAGLRFLGMEEKTSRILTRYLNERLDMECEMTNPQTSALRNMGPFSR